MSDEIPLEVMQVATALIEIADHAGGKLLTETQLQTFKSIRSLQDGEEKGRRTMEVMNQLLQDAESGQLVGKEIQAQVKSHEGQFTAEAERELRNSTGQFESRIRAEAQQVLREVSAGSGGVSTARRSRVRV